MMTEKKKSYGNTRHGMHLTPEYKTWIRLKERCYNPNHQHFAHYGGRGISVCERWRNSFENFYADMGPRPLGCSIDRVNNDGSYSPENCRWADELIQKSNRSDNRVIAYNGEKLTVAQWARRMRMNYTTLHERLRAGWSVSDALTKLVDTSHR